MSTMASNTTALNEILQTVNDLPSSSGKEDKGKLTINGTEYTLAISTTDAGTAGYITFVVEE